MDAPKPHPSRSQMLFAFGLAGQLGFMIGLPIVALALGGRFLDIRMGTSPLFLLLGALLAAVTSGIWVYRSVDRLRQAYESHTKNT